MAIVLPTAYLPPISWFAQLCSGEPIVIEQCENFHRQTIRNRCSIDAPNGVLNLTVPVDKSNFRDGAKCQMRDVKISYSSDWRHQHWNAIKSSYFNSPFFEYLQDDFFPIYRKQWTFLMDLNEALIMKCCELIDIQPNISRSTEYMGTVQTRTEPMVSPYYQVFAHKHGFQQDLSIVDLIFNLGPEALLYLTKSER